MEVSVGNLLRSGEQHALTRESGRQFYPRLVTWLKSTPEHQVLRVTVPNGLLMDYSFADETLGRLLEELVSSSWGERYITVEVSSGIQYENLVASLRLRKVPARVRFQGNYHLVVPDARGREELQETVDLVDRYRRTTASDLARDHGLGPTAWNNRLVRAYRARLVFREPEILTSGGRQYIYSSVIYRD